MRGPASTSLRVLIVDDNEDTALILAYLLRLCGHEVRVVHDGPSAVEAAQEDVFDAVVLDIGLPRMDGFEVARQLRLLPELSHLLIVATSGYNRERDLRRASELGIDHYLVKPFDPNQLKKLLAARRATEAIPA